MDAAPALCLQGYTNGAIESGLRAVAEIGALGGKQD